MVFDRQVEPAVPCQRFISIHGPIANLFRYPSNPFCR